MSQYSEHRSGSITAPSIIELEESFIKSGAAEQQLFTTFDVDGASPELIAAAQDRQEQKKLFLAGEIGQPQLNNCPRFDQGRDARYKTSLAVELVGIALHSRRQWGETPTPGDKVLTDLVKMRGQEYRAVELAAAVAGTANTQLRLQLANGLKSELRSAYGMPEPDTALSTLAGRVQTAHQVAEDRDHPVSDMAREAIGAINISGSGYEPPKLMDGTSREYYRSIIETECQTAVDYAFQSYGDKGIYSVDETVAIFRRYLDARGFSEAGFDARLVPNRTSCLASMSEQAILIGDKRSELMRSRKKITDSLLHEAEIHIGRMARGRVLGMRLAGYALARANNFEEPFAVTCVDVYQDVSKLHGEPYTTAIALSAGYDGGGERDFRGTHELTWRLSLLKSFKEDKPLDSQIKTARSVAYDALVRIWRGMPTDVPGCIMPRDHTYDNAAIHSFLQHDGKVLSPEEFLQLSQARYDPRDANQRDYVEQFSS